MNELGVKISTNRQLHDLYTPNIAGLRLMIPIGFIAISHKCYYGNCVVLIEKRLGFRKNSF